MGILNDNLEDEFDYKVCVINQLKDYVHKFYGIYSPTVTSYEIEGYKNVDVVKLIYIVECSEEKIMGAYVCIGHTLKGLTISVLEENRLFFNRLTDKNGYGMDITFQKVVDFLSNYDPTKYSRDYDLFYNIYIERDELAGY